MVRNLNNIYEIIDINFIVTNIPIKERIIQATRSDPVVRGLGSMHKIRVQTSSLSRVLFF